MALLHSFTSPSTSMSVCFSKSHQTLTPALLFPFSSFTRNKTRRLRLVITAASKPQTRQTARKKSQSSSSTSSASSSLAATGSGSTNKKRRRKGKSGDSREDWDMSEAGILDEDDDDDSSSNLPTMPKPPAGFVIDESGRVLMASKKRIATITDTTNKSPLDCVIRRIFTSSRGDECMLLCPVDAPVQILKSTNIDGWAAVSDDEIEALLPAAAFALAKIHMHLVHSGFCYTARGGFCYTEDNVFDFRTDDGKDVEGLPTEGVEVTCFHLDGAHYMIYTPSDPLLFVAVQDPSGKLQIADDELLDDPAVISAIDEETEFNALVEEEAALLESLIGERL